MLALGTLLIPSSLAGVTLMTALQQEEAGEPAAGVRLSLEPQTHYSLELSAEHLWTSSETQVLSSIAGRWWLGGDPSGAFALTRAGIGTSIEARELRGLFQAEVGMGMRFSDAVELSSTASSLWILEDAQRWRFGLSLTLFPQAGGPPGGWTWHRPRKVQ